MEILNSLCYYLFATFYHSLSPILVLGLPQTIIPWFPTPLHFPIPFPPSFITLSSQTLVHCCCASPSSSRLFSSLLLPEVSAPAAIVRSILVRVLEESLFYRHWWISVRVLLRSCSTAIDESMFVFCCVLVLPPLFLHRRFLGSISEFLFLISEFLWLIEFLGSIWSCFNQA